MKRRLTCLIIAVLFVTTAAQAAPCRDVRALTAFIAAHSDLAALPDCVTVLPLAGFAGTVRIMSQAGAYDPATGQIALAPDLDLSGILGQSYLLHELVHYGQFHGGTAATVRCPAELEAEAYALQARYLRDNGLPHEALVLTTLAAPLTICGPSDAAY